ncbi:hypothetical protein SB768_24345 [Burkholderia sp. SIMBA_043]|uniref:hypothetical protein n=1 Tax=Burkholderia TaxID=32008 RepID=UPI0005DA6443|nr:hypothetical protein [Burkholderia vietnamiensis]AJY04961.1 hypothetical protein AK36_3633 [Burkholderia vietnamiensis LMG 10929]UBI23948.1 hypothetical protein LA325_08855 [Burkholderia vietnamiensis]HDR9008663.1 hypothetical protein [Burkholderia vietnamiensis]HDR9014454.1 hypothetical protein [Burkholderia vietnamiensis]
MNNSSKFIALLFVTSLSVPLSFAGEAIIFDQPGLVGFRDGSSVSGFYDSRNAKFSCSFLFAEDGGKSDAKDVDGYAATSLLTFIMGEKSPSFSSRNKAFDIRATLYRRDDEWVIQTEAGQAGCENATGTFTFGPKDYRSVSYRVTQQVPAIGIRIAKSKTLFYDNRDGRFFARKSYLVYGDGVVVLKTQGDFSYIRYVGAGPRGEGRVTFGWVRTADLVDPFPKSTE